MLDWDRCNGNIAEFLKRNLFIKKDQLVVPSLKLKSAKKIFAGMKNKRKDSEK